MSLSRPVTDLTGTFNSVYQINLDMSGWDETTVQLVAPMVGTVYVYGSNDANALQGVRDGDASLAINFTPILATNLATDAAVASMTAAGLYKVDVNARFLRLQGNPVDVANVYRILFQHNKVS